jgi:hypothetical protein
MKRFMKTPQDYVESETKNEYVKEREYEKIFSSAVNNGNRAGIIKWM